MPLTVTLMKIILGLKCLSSIIDTDLKLKVDPRAVSIKLSLLTSWLKYFNLYLMMEKNTNRQIFLTFSPFYINLSALCVAV